MAITFSASLRPTRARILLIALTVALLLGYGLFTAQRARSATTLAKKAFAGVKVSLAGTATLVHPVHVTGVTETSTGDYILTFDRHMDNCSFAMDNDLNGGVGTFNANAFAIGNAAKIGVGTTSQEFVVQTFPGGNRADDDFDIIALCPGT